MYGAGAEKLKELLERIELSNGDRVSITEIWTLTPMPPDGFSEEELNAVDLSAADQKTGPNRETIREMIRQTYHCESSAEKEKYVRRLSRTSTPHNPFGLLSIESQDPPNRILD